MRNVCEERRRGAACQWFFVALTGAVLWAPLFLQAQAPARHNRARAGALHQPATPSGPEQPKFKGIFEPVNFNQDLRLTDVFFVAPEVGYVSGFAGTILKTVDGGKTWTAQLGGDPQSQEQPINHLFFLDASHGWALQAAGGGKKLLRTTDGENWEQAGIVPEAVIEYQFVSPSAGILLEGNPNFSRIYRSDDGGATWKETLPQSACRFNAQVEGLSRQVDCVLCALAVASPMEAYAVGYTNLPDMIIVAKTQDGGMTWSLAATHGPSNVFDYYGRQWQSLFFLDPRNGLLATQQERLYATSDGGASWHGVAGAAGQRISFADPEVGWAFEGNVLKYTSDGGKRWFSRSLNFPAGVQAFSLPQRNTGYVVGYHGMIYRYRVVPATYQAAARSIDAPAMPGFDSPVPGEVATLKEVVAKLRDKLPVPTGSVPPSDGTSSSGSAAPGDGGFQQDTGSGPVAGGYMDSCCAPLIQQLETTANSFATNVPAYSQRFRNLNLILEGLALVNNIASQANSLKQSIRALRRAPNQQAAAMALTNVQSQLNGISSSGGFVQDVSTPLQR